MEISTGTSRRRASAKASSPQGHHSTGLSACCNRYGLVASLSRLAIRPTVPADPTSGHETATGRVGHTLQREVSPVCSSESPEDAGTSLLAVSWPWALSSWASSWAAFSALLFSAKGASLLVILRMRKYRTRA